MKSLFPILLCLLLLPLTACQPDFSGSRMGTPRGTSHVVHRLSHHGEADPVPEGRRGDCPLPGQPGGDPVHHHLEGEEEPIYEGEGLTTQDFTVEVEEAGLYTVAVTGQGAVGSVDITVGQAPLSRGHEEDRGRNFCKPPKFDGKNGGNP